MTLDELIRSLQQIKSMNGERGDIPVQLYGKPYRVVDVSSALWKSGVHVLLNVEKK